MNPTSQLSTCNFLSSVALLAKEDQPATSRTVAEPGARTFLSSPQSGQLVCCSNSASYERSTALIVPKPISHSSAAADRNVRAPVLRPLFQRPELFFFFILLVIFNTPVLFGSGCQSLMFQSDAVRNGQWWRLLTHPFVHVTWYHLLLDGTAFLTLYYSLVENKLFYRLLYVFAAGAGSLLLSWAATSAMATSGLCGLSGIAHGLMAISALEMVAGNPPHSAERRIGLVSFILVISKAAFEAVTGRMFFAFLDFGLLGDPVAVSHAGGIVGSLLAMFLVRCRRRDRPQFLK
ncbi:MAG: hypothetical protein QOJ40_731 [Verrucomicrobiota bacterium]